MSRIVLPRMLELKKGAIVNISSVSGAIPTPLLAVYSATKVYIDYFSRCLQAEYKDSGVIIQCVMPSFVTTKMSKIRRASWLIPNPQTYVKAALATLGVESLTCGCTAHGLQINRPNSGHLTLAEHTFGSHRYISTTIPEWLYMWVTMKILLNQTKRARQKRQKAQ